MQSPIFHRVQADRCKRNWRLYIAAVKANDLVILPKLRRRLHRVENLMQWPTRQAAVELMFGSWEAFCEVVEAATK
jgi:hypothetical protein